MTRSSRTTTFILACLAAAGGSGEAAADVLVPGSTFDFGLVSATSAGEYLESAVFGGAQPGRSNFYFRNDWSPMFGNSPFLEFGVYEEERGPNGYQLIFFLQAYNDDLFPDRPGIASYNGGFGLGIVDAVDLTGTFRLTEATMEFQDGYGQRVDFRELLDGSGIPTDTAWDGRFPGGSKGIVFPNISGKDVEAITLRLDVERFTPTAGPGEPAVPEPAAWAMMLLGFGLVGGAVRRRRARPAFA